jgi:hypothetical protein
MEIDGSKTLPSLLWNEHLNAMRVEEMRDPLQELPNGCLALQMVNLESKRRGRRLKRRG